MLRVAVDVGGTFTDVVVADTTGRLILGKALSTPDRSFDGLYAALANAAAEMEREADDLLLDAGILIYGTTRSTNAIVEGKVAKTPSSRRKASPTSCSTAKAVNTIPFGSTSRIRRLTCRGGSPSRCRNASMPRAGSSARSTRMPRAPSCKACQRWGSRQSRSAFFGLSSTMCTSSASAR